MNFQWAYSRPNYASCQPIYIGRGLSGLKANKYSRYYKLWMSAANGWATMHWAGRDYRPSHWRGHRAKRIIISAKWTESVCLCAHGCSVLHTIHSKLRTSNLTSTTPGTVRTWSLKFSKRGAWPGSREPPQLQIHLADICTLWAPSSYR